MTPADTRFARWLRSPRMSTSRVDYAYAVEHYRHESRSAHAAEWAMLWAAIGYALGWLTWGR